MSNIWGNKETQFFFELNPDLILDSVEALGLKATGRCLALNSMENRVYEVEIDIEESHHKTASDHFVIAKFYRPGRWTKEQILEEHQFLLDLKNKDIPVIAPIQFNKQTLFQVPGHLLWYTLFPKKGGRMMEELNEEQLLMMGRLLARMHNVGAQKDSKHRLKINPTTFGTDNLNYLLSTNYVPLHLKESLKKTTENLINQIIPLFQNIKTHRIHGDCHQGNIIMREGETPYFIDFDDMLVGPAIQDIWLIIPGTDQEAINNRNILLEGYESMRNFDYSTLKLIEPLRALRYIHFAAWMAKRWEDPAFKTAFPHFGTEHYFDILISDLKVQQALIHDSLVPTWE